MLEPLGVQVADGDDAGDVVLEDPRHIHVVGDAAAADLADLDLVAGRVGAQDGGGDDGGQHGCAGGAGQGGLEELSAGEVEMIIHNIVTLS